jgi:DNA-binding NarL/FixJ family response regulator
MVLELAGIEVVGEAADGAEAVALARRLRPDVALTDMRMPGTDGIEATRRIVADGLPTRVLILTTFDLDEHVYDALQAGASGFLLKDIGREQLVEAVRTVADGDALFAPTVLRRLVAHYVGRPPLEGSSPHARGVEQTGRSRSCASSGAGSRTARSPRSCSSRWRP